MQDYAATGLPPAYLPKDVSAHTDASHADLDADLDADPGPNDDQENEP